jgi:hypothetical protein
VTARDPTPTPDTPEAIPELPSDPAGPVFGEPWDAQAGGDPDTGETYYRHWLAALERLVADKRLSDQAELARYRDAWKRAAGRTPHGTPIELEPQDFG